MNLKRKPEKRHDEYPMSLRDRGPFKLWEFAAQTVIA
jgi:hypothetical protein